MLTVVVPSVLYSLHEQIKCLSLMLSSISWFVGWSFFCKNVFKNATTVTLPVLALATSDNGIQTGPILSRPPRWPRQVQPLSLLRQFRFANVIELRLKSNLSSTEKKRQNVQQWMSRFWPNLKLQLGLNFCSTNRPQVTLASRQYTRTYLKRNCNLHTKKF